MLFRILDPSKGHLNGAIYTVGDMQSNVLLFRFASEVNRGSTIPLLLVPYGHGDDSFPVPNFTRIQFPVHVCISITTNKSQGQPYSGRIGLDCVMAASRMAIYTSRFLRRPTHPKSLCASLQVALLQIMYFNLNFCCRKI